MNAITFSELAKLPEAERISLGGKGKSLVSLSERKFPVPPGFVVPGKTFQAFIERFGLVAKIRSLLEGLTEERLEAQAGELQACLLNAPLPSELEAEWLEAYKMLQFPFVAVRSSASVEDGANLAWAGLFDSFMNCREENLVQAVKRCWASLYSPRTLSYALEHNIPYEQVSMAVVVQAMIASESAGTAFSRHPVTKNPEQVFIESAFGLGESVVSGAVTPDQYVYCKKEEQLLESNISVKERMLYRGGDGRNRWKYLMRKEARAASLSSSEALELSGLVSSIEKNYGHPVDVEWAREAGKWYILQSRPITA